MNKQKRQHFHAKMNSAKLYIHSGVGSRNLFIDEAHTALGMGIFPVFSPACCLLRFAAFFIFWGGVSNFFKGLKLFCSKGEGSFISFCGRTPHKKNGRRGGGCPDQILSVRFTRNSSIVFKGKRFADQYNPMCYSLQSYFPLENCSNKL